jgi:Flp pilus assembly protein TadD
MRLSKLAPPILVCALALQSFAMPVRASAACAASADASVSVSATRQPDTAGAPSTTHADALRDAQQTAQDAGSAPPRKRSNAFLRALGAPFRALARLFGGSKKDSTARNRSVAPPQRPQTAVVIEPTPTPERVIEGGQQTQATPAPVQQRNADERHVRPEVAGGNTPTFTERPAPTATPALPQPEDAITFTPFVEGVPRDPLSQGRALLERGQTTDAIAQLSAAAITSPDLIAANNLLGLAYDRLGRHDEAQVAYERALAAAPADAATLNNLGYSLYLSDRYREALARLRQAARLDPASPQVANNLALVYGRLGKFDDAFKNFARAHGEFYARVQTAALLEEAGRDRDAIRHFEAARRLDPANAEVLRRLINLYMRTGQPGKAEDARQMLEKIPADRRGDGATSSSSV